MSRPDMQQVNITMNRRRQVRAEWHDYCEGIFFVTICSHGMRQIFGAINAQEMHLSELGSIVEQCLNEIPRHHPDVELLNHVVMPNHVHLVVAIGARFPATVPLHDGDTDYGCLRLKNGEPDFRDMHHNSRLANVIGSFKAAVTRIMRNRIPVDCKHAGIGREFSRPYWQSRYYDHIIRNQQSFDKIMHYIDTNVILWKKDTYYDS